MIDNQGKIDLAITCPFMYHMSMIEEFLIKLMEGKPNEQS